MQETDPLHFKTRGKWRAWLEKNHDKADEVWLLYYKKHTGKPTIPYNEAVEEALCFGWIDGKVKRIDDEKHMQRYSPRKPESIWSQSNKKRVGRMIQRGRMTPAGMALVKAAKESGQWQKASETYRYKMHPDFEEALKHNKKAGQFFENLAPSYRKHYLWWTASAKRDDTRKRRIKKLIEAFKQGRKHGLE